jgi:hypothetical protein
LFKEIGRVASDTDIANLALAHLGDDAAITSFDPPDGSAQAEHCARFYPIARDVCLEAHAWTFAKRTIQLSETTTAVNDYDFVYVLPSDCLKVLRIYPEGWRRDLTGIDEFETETDEEGQKILLTDLENAVPRLHPARRRHEQVLADLRHRPVLPARLDARRPGAQGRRGREGEQILVRGVARLHRHGSDARRHQPAPQPRPVAERDRREGLMANVRSYARSFVGGEVTPEFFGRFDDLKNQTGLQVCRNAIVKPHGPVANRGGLRFIAKAKNAATTAAVRLLPFVYSSDQSAVIEVGPGYFRFFILGAALLTPAATAWSNATAYVLGDLATVGGTTYYCILAHTNTRRPTRPIGTRSPRPPTRFRAPTRRPTSRTSSSSSRTTC